MPGSIRIADIQPPVTAPLFLQVNVGKKEYSGTIGQDDFSLPVTSIRDSMVMTLYDADKELVSKTEVKTRLIVELGSMDVVFNLGSGGTIILQLKFLLSDEDRKRIQEMRNSVMKRKQQELLGNGNELYFQDSPLPKEQTEENSDVPSKEDQFTLRKSMSVDDLKDQLMLRKSMSLDDLKERFVFSESSADLDAAAPKVPTPPQSGGSIWTLEGPVDIGSKKGQGKPGSGSSSAVKKMISAFESSSPQALPWVPRIKSESSLEGMMSVDPEASTDPSRKPPTPSPSSNVSGYTQTGLVARTRGKVTMTVPSADAAGVSLSGKQAMISNKKPNMHESRRRSSRQSAGANDMIRPEKRSVEKRRRRSMSTYSSPEQPQASRSAATSSSIITWIGHPHVCITSGSRQLKDIVDLEHLKSMKNATEETEEGSGDDEARRFHGFPVLNGWLINQGVRGVIVIIACGAVFFNNR